MGVNGVRALRFGGGSQAAGEHGPGVVKVTLSPVLMPEVVASGRATREPIPSTSIGRQHGPHRTSKDIESAQFQRAGSADILQVGSW